MGESSSARASTFGEEYWPAAFPGNGFQVRVRIDGERMFRHGKHLRVPARVAESSVNSLPYDLAQRLRFAGARGDAYQAIGGKIAIERDFSRQNAILRDAEMLHSGANDPLIGGGNGPDFAAILPQAAHEFEHLRKNLLGEGLIDELPGCLHHLQ